MIPTIRSHLLFVFSFWLAILNYLHKITNFAIFNRISKIEVKIYGYYLEIDISVVYLVKTRKLVTNCLIILLGILIGKNIIKFKVNIYKILITNNKEKGR